MTKRTRPPYTEVAAIRDAQDRANRDQAPMHIYRGISLGCDVLWYVRDGAALPPHDAPLHKIITPHRDDDPSIYDQLVAAGVPLDHHESGLYAKVTPVSQAIIAAYKFRSNVTVFTDQIERTPWYDIPFAYQPFWDRARRIANGDKT